jgi:3-oxoacyl-[acyl-carrier-protein] synthase-1
VGVCVGTSTAGIASTEGAWKAARETGTAPPGWVIERQHALFATAQVAALRVGARGPVLAVSTACSSSAKVFAHALRWLRAGLCDAVLVGGVDTLCAMTLCGFRSLEVLSRERCRPFSSERRGINIGEGGAFFLIERDGVGPRLLGVGESSDAHHMTAPHPTGAGAQAAMARALRSAGVAADAVDQVNLHATATPQNDAAEGNAVRELFGRPRLEAGKTKLVATKGATGHMLGAAGAIEALFCLAAIERQAAPPSVGCDPLDEAIGVPLSARAIEAPTRVVLSNSLAFGGSNVCVAFGAPEAT